MRTAEEIVENLMTNHDCTAPIKFVLIEILNIAMADAIHEFGLTMHEEMMGRISVLYHDGRKREYEETVYDQMEKEIINKYKLK